MAFKVSFVSALVALLGLTAAQSVAASDVHHQRVVEPATRQLTAASPMVASPATCPGQTNLDAPAAAQEQAMRCMIDFARLQVGLESLSPSDALDLSAHSKAGDVLRCDSFSHFACGREFSYWIRASGFMSTPCWRVGENLAWGEGEYGTVRALFQALMRSPTHRANILGDYEQLGLSLRTGALGKHNEAHVWTQHFGTHC